MLIPVICVQIFLRFISQSNLQTLTFFLKFILIVVTPLSNILYIEFLLNSLVYVCVILCAHQSKYSIESFHISKTKKFEMLTALFPSFNTYALHFFSSLFVDQYIDHEIRYFFSNSWRLGKISESEVYIDMFNLYASTNNGLYIYIYSCHT